MSDVYLNNKFVGTVDNGKGFTEHLVSERRKSQLSHNVNVSHHEVNNEVHINCTQGRARRPLIVVKDGKPVLTEQHIKQLEKNELTWSDLLQQGIIEYLDAAEEENTLIAWDETQLTPEHTHLEVVPFAIVGIATALVPYGHFNPSARLNGGSKNQKQALGFYAANYLVRMDMDVNLLHTPQLPIVRTFVHDAAEYDKHPSGQNVVVAIMSYEGYNMEDAVILNKASIERGLGRSTYYRPAIAEELRYSGGLVDEISVPDKDVKGYRTEHEYRYLEEDGIVHTEAVVHEGDVIIGRTSPPRFLSALDEYNLAGATRRESSMSLKHGEEGIIDFVLITENAEGNKLVQVRIRDQRIPEVGDKFTSRHGQKGVIGLIVPQTDIPFSINGTVPDLIFSPHSIPSRMTLSHLIEMIGGKVGSLAGRYIDGTLFAAEPEDKLRQELLSMGFRDDGTETFYSGLTGEKMNARIFIGDMYYLRLKHMVANKIHSR
ncbi:MAG TPA: DNA-directed RNA polymerase subunit B, partial [Candidatus Nanoarchaeia archaeon]|nr:DNA-directed RNA polymerase subunit B [Candidatus Nanoarchaeia archaeon]